MEEWRPVIGYEGLYSVSNLGRVRAEAKVVRVGRNGGVDCRPARVLNTSTHPNGHLRVWLAKDGAKRAKLVHRLAAEAFVPNLHDLPIVNHLDSNPANNAPGNLEWTTHGGNTKHAYDSGRIAMPRQKGSRNSNAKLSATTVRAIRSMHASRVAPAAIARQFGVHPKTIRDICKRRRWGHLR